MSRPTFASLFTGLACADMGAQAAGCAPIWGLEIDPHLARAASANSGAIVQAINILEADAGDYAPVDVLHASPPCPNFSIASVHTSESETDRALARKVAHFVTTIRPRIFTLENVYAYRQSDSWRIIEQALNDAGYWTTTEHSNAADHGVPQTRKRLIVRAALGSFVAAMPEALPWIGWKAAINDLIDSLPAADLQPWQIKRLPPIWRDTLISNGISRDRKGQEYGIVVRDGAAPAMTITTIGPQAWKAVLVDFTNAGRKATLRDEEKPAMTVTASHGRRSSNLLSAWISEADIRKLSIQALARLQTIPDRVVYPPGRRRTMAAIGNALPPAWYARILGPMLETL